MNWQQFELRRLHIAAWLFLYAIVCFVIYMQGSGDKSFFLFCGVLFLAGSIGAPFKRAILSAALVFGLTVVFFAVMLTWIVVFNVQVTE